MNTRRKTSELQIDRFAEAMEEFLLEAEPIVNDLKAMTKGIEEKLRELILYYGEDPTTTKSEEFFDIISTFSRSFDVSNLFYTVVMILNTSDRKRKLKYTKHEKEPWKDNVSKSY